MEINVKDARSRLSSLLNQVEKGGEVVILRRGKAVARLTLPEGEGKLLPGLKDFRASIKIAGEPMSKAVVHGRKAERY